MVAPGQQAHVDKIKSTLKAIKDKKWDSLNEFLMAYYSSKDEEVVRSASKSLTFYPGRPRRRWTAWLGR